MYKCIKPCIAVGHDYSRKVQVNPNEQFKIKKRLRNTITLSNARRTIHVTNEQLENNFISI